jgi:2-polyprenyl-6-methoxyphenol hydroxylase-like FAD-dependent oxidoreductase
LSDGGPQLFPVLEAPMKAIIAGGGIGGLTTALFLHARGIACEIYEQAEKLKELGVGITLMPHAIRQLVDLGLLGDLDACAIRSEHLYYMTRRGQLVWDEPRGLLAGHDVPQFFIHRGMLQSLLHRAVASRLPKGSLRLGERVAGFLQTPTGVTATVQAREGTAFEAEGDILVGADGIHSAVRGALVPGEGGPLWSGLMLWRGATDWPAFLGGASLLILGGVEAKFVAYPIAPGQNPGTRLTNWAAITRLAPFGSAPPRRENWSREGSMADLAPLLAAFRTEIFDVEALVRATDVFWEYPMCDRTPIERWSHGRVTLLGDAAHPMYPMGANGASQAILDARALADALAATPRPEEALRAYEAQRLPGTSEIVRLNRIGGPEAVIDVVEKRAPDGFDDVDAVLSREERGAIVRGYASKAATLTTGAAVQG